MQTWRQVNPTPFQSIAVNWLACTLLYMSAGVHPNASAAPMEPANRPQGVDPAASSSMLSGLEEIQKIQSEMLNMRSQSAATLLGTILPEMNTVSSLDASTLHRLPASVVAELHADGLEVVDAEKEMHVAAQKYAAVRQRVRARSASSFISCAHACFAPVVKAGSKNEVDDMAD